MKRYGWASGQTGKVLVLNRLCTSASALSTRSSLEVGEERRELRRGEHALVDERAAAERREVRLLLGGQLVLDALAGDEHLAVEVDAGRAGWVRDEQLLERRHHRPRAGAEAVGMHGHRPPAERGQALVGDDRLDRALRLLGIASTSAGRNARPTA